MHYRFFDLPIPDSCPVWKKQKKLKAKENSDRRQFSKYIINKEEAEFLPFKPVLKAKPFFFWLLDSLFQAQKNDFWREIHRKRKKKGRTKKKKEKKKNLFFPLSLSLSRLNFFLYRIIPISHHQQSVVWLQMDGDDLNVFSPRLFYITLQY